MSQLTSIASQSGTSEGEAFPAFQELTVLPLNLYETLDNPHSGAFQELSWHVAPRRTEDEEDEEDWDEDEEDDEDWDDEEEDDYDDDEDEEEDDDWDDEDEDDDYDDDEDEEDEEEEV